MPKSYSVCTKVQEKSNIWWNQKNIGEILRKLCVQKGVEIIETEVSADHIHMLVSIPLHISVSQFTGYLKGKSSLMILARYANLKYKYGSRTFWCKGVLCRHSRSKQKGNRRIYKKSIIRRLRSRPIESQRVHSLVYGYQE